MYPIYILPSHLFDMHFDITLPSTPRFYKWDFHPNTFLCIFFAVYIWLPIISLICPKSIMNTSAFLPKHNDNRKYQIFWNDTLYSLFTRLLLTLTKTWHLPYTLKSSMSEVDTWSSGMSENMPTIVNSWTLQYAKSCIRHRQYQILFLVPRLAIQKSFCRVFVTPRYILEYCLKTSQDCVHTLPNSSSTVTLSFLSTTHRKGFAILMLD